MGNCGIVAIAQLGMATRRYAMCQWKLLILYLSWQKQANQNKGKLMPGTYEIRLEMKPSEVKSEPIYTTLSFKIG